VPINYDQCNLACAATAIDSVATSHLTLVPLPPQSSASPTAEEISYTRAHTAFDGMRARDAAARQPRPRSHVGLPPSPTSATRGGVDVAATATQAGGGSGSAREMSPHLLIFPLVLTSSLRFPSMSRFVRFFLPSFLSLVASSPFFFCRLSRLLLGRPFWRRKVKILSGQKGDLLLNS
jgi:hypothetical protein